MKTRVTEEFRISQLKTAEENLDHYIEYIKQGKTSLLRPLSVLMRALICKGRTLSPLFVDLANEKGYGIEFYSDDINYDFMDMLQDVLFSTTSFSFYIDKPADEPQLKKYILDTWLDTHIVCSAKEKITGNDLIRLTAEKFGDGHYDLTLTDRELTLTQISFGYGELDIKSHDAIVFQVSEIIHYHIKKFLSTYYS
jgi:hypothetical protein